MPITEARRKDRQGSAEEAMSILASARFGHLGTVTRDGYPYVVPVNHALDGERIYVHSARQGHKIDNIIRDAKVCFEVSEMSDLVRGDVPCKYGAFYKSAIAFGRAIIVSDPEEKIRALRVISLKYTGMDGPFTEQDVASVSVIRIDVEKATCKMRA